MGVQQRALIGEKPVGEHRAAQVHKVQDVQVHVRWDIAVDQAAQKGRQRQPHHGDKQPDGSVEGAVELEQGANGRGIILRDGLVHAEHHGTSHAQLRQVQEGQNGTEQAAEAQILHAQIIEHDGTQEKGNDDVEQFQHAIKRDVTRCVFRSFDFHPSIHPFWESTGSLLSAHLSAKASKPSHLQNAGGAKGHPNLLHFFMRALQPFRMNR